jgi:catechol 2,3-dioxygenase-like lactoylglutathione lyase family enzyme
VIEVTRVDYIRVPVNDIAAAQQFYGEILGLPRNEHLDHDDWIEYEAPNVTLAVMTPESHEQEFAVVPPGTIALGVPDVAAAKAELESKGLEVGEMWDNGICNGAGVSDPAGNRILLHHRYKAYDEV